jgi:transcriptional regulator with XRE-family HTH domain
VTGWSQAQIAKKLGVSKASVSYSIQTGASPAITFFVSQLLGIPEAYLWPYRRSLIGRPEPTPLEGRETGKGDR